MFHDENVEASSGIVKETKNNDGSTNFSSTKFIEQAYIRNCKEHIGTLSSDGISRKVLKYQQ
jgi:hypothetical protein